jgi:hypothetical protein
MAGGTVSIPGDSPRPSSQKHQVRTKPVVIEMLGDRPLDMFHALARRTRHTIRFQLDTPPFLRGPVSTNFVTRIVQLGNTERAVK